MFIGFDYGTANCSVAVMRDGKPQLLKMENDSTLLPSMLCAPTREAVSEWLYRHHDVPADDDETQALLRRAIRYNREEDIDVTAKSVQFGLSSLAQYIDDPEEVWFVKSPKSFLGASGLKPQQVALFEDLVCAMMLHIRQQAQAQLPEAITQAVIGRPINFQGLGGDEANAQAQGILEQVQLALDNAQEKPDVIYLTGGSARSPLIKKALAEQLPGIPIAGGDDFGSVTAGLARWAEVVFR
ncbi:TPA: Hsp70 family protein [Escherichia coli]|nr:Hsp70 family protein [Escherichia coli]HAH9179810.1 Hsp70 family protein [Escherichia coli]HAH9184304.1 Hsp70 family protein [Escherichia coli]HAH9207093.1 Hsp70 family protein [Escherichia coli]HAH9425649.1 Hsp70 family protein [Escherichia coli]